MKNPLTAKDIREAIEKPVLIVSEKNGDKFKSLAFTCEGIEIDSSEYGKVYFSFDESFTSYNSVAEQYNEIDIG